MPPAAPTSLLLAALALTLGAQGRRPAPPSRAVPVRVALTVGGRAAESRGTGVCYHRPDLVHEGQPARQWSVSYSSVAGGAPVAVVLALTVPRGAATGPFSATLTTHRKLRRLAVGTPRPSGSGTVTPTPDGAGWRLTFDARAADGAEVKGTVTCERTSPLS